MLISQKWQVHFCEGSPSACAFGAASGGRRERKPKVFIRSDAPPQGAFSCPFGSIHLVVVRAGISLRGCAPLTTPRDFSTDQRKFLLSVDTEGRQGFERARWAMKRKALPVRQGGREANATLTDYAELRVCPLYPNRN